MYHRTKNPTDINPNPISRRSWRCAGEPVNGRELEAALVAGAGAAETGADEEDKVAGTVVVVVVAPLVVVAGVVEGVLTVELAPAVAQFDESPDWHALAMTVSVSEPPGAGE